MRKTRILKLGAVASLAVGAAQASTLFASGPVFGNPKEAEAVCYVFNSGTTAVTISASAIYNQAGQNITTSQPCGRKLQPNSSCAISGPLGTGAAYCAITVSSTANLRGSIDIRSAGSTPTVFATEQLH